MSKTLKEYSLSSEEVALFHEHGYLGPFPAVTPEEMAAIAEHIENNVLQCDGPSPRARVQSRYMDSRVVFDLASHPAILDRMESLYGPHLILWATYFFSKDPGGKEIPWHQDLNYWPLEPIINISAWIAIDEVTVENSCVQIIPGSHKKVVPHIKSRDGMAFGEEADENYFSKENMVNMEMAPGEFFLFNEKLLHHSEPNHSDRRRMGMTVRVTIPIVKIDHDRPPLHPGHAAVLLRGEDYMGFNRLVEPPKSG
jgi:ectoine hydroxylase-related dioxygenase (phytanoyl-CoA dioxygenase family)